MKADFVKMMYDDAMKMTSKGFLHVVEKHGQFSPKDVEHFYR